MIFVRFIYFILHVTTFQGHEDTREEVTNIHLSVIIINSSTNNPTTFVRDG